LQILFKKPRQSALMIQFIEFKWGLVEKMVNM
jgi:hypothetical protein